MPHPHHRSYPHYRSDYGLPYYGHTYIPTYYPMRRRDNLIIYGLIGLSIALIVVLILKK